MFMSGQEKNKYFFKPKPSRCTVDLLGWFGFHAKHWSPTLAEDRSRFGFPIAVMLGDASVKQPPQQRKATQPPAGGTTRGYRVNVALQQAVPAAARRDPFIYQLGAGVGAGSSERKLHQDTAHAMTTRTTSLDSASMAGQPGEVSGDGRTACC